MCVWESVYTTTLLPVPTLHLRTTIGVGVEDYMCGRICEGERGEHMSVWKSE